MATAEAVAPATNARGGWRIGAGWAGIAFVPLFVVGMLMSMDSPDSNASDAKWVAWYAQRSHRVELLVGGYILVVAGLALIGFVAGLAQRLQAGATQSPVAYRLMGWAGPIAGVLIMVGAIQAAGVAGDISFGGQPVPHAADVLRSNLGFPFIGVAGALAGAVLVASATLVAKRLGFVASWLVWLGWIAAVALLFGVIFIPMIALPIWVLATSITLLRSGA